MKPISLVLALGMVLVSSCISTQYDRSTIQEQKDYIVVIEKHKSGQNIEHTHPANVDGLMMKEIMKGFQYVKTEGVLNMEHAGPVFQQVEIDRLAGALASALADSDKSQYVRFVSLNKKKTLLLLTTYHKTEGILFMDSESRINFAFSHINSQISSDDPMSLRAEFSNKNPVKITKSNTKLTSSSSLFQGYVSANGRSFPMWMTVIIKKAPSKEVDSKKTAISEQNESLRKETKTITAPITPEEMAVQKEIKEKLIYLKDLLNEGLITETDYNTQKRLLLDRLK